MNTLHEPLLVLDERLHVISANLIFCNTFQLDANKIHGHSIFNIWDQKVPKNLLQQLFADKLKNTEYYYNFNLPYSFKKNNQQNIIINARRILHRGIGNSQIILTIALNNPTGENSYDQT